VHHDGWTRRDAAFLDRVALGRTGTWPPGPSIRVERLDAQEETDAV